ncbi:PspC domain-containing protein [Georgenia alba]|uniref:PspC domain-containing protein n=1 Tax=Georgenia alba TaxID=2233858 RepID=A0ABW2Q944_9MICO
MSDIRASLARSGLVRPRGGRIVAGVCAGLGRRLGVHPWALRLVFLLLLVIPGPSLVTYLVLWILMPDEA